jgi:hypothetical protein
VALQMDAATAANVAEPWKVEPNDRAEELWIVD